MSLRNTECIFYIAILLTLVLVNFALVVYGPQISVTYSNKF